MCLLSTWNWSLYVVEVGSQLCFPSCTSIPNCHSSVYHSFSAELFRKCPLVYISWAPFYGLFVFLKVLTPIVNFLNFYEFMSWCLSSKTTSPRCFFFIGAFNILVSYHFHINFSICLHSRVGVKGWGRSLGFGYGLRWICRPIWRDLTTLY